MESETEEKAESEQPLARWQVILRDYRTEVLTGGVTLVFLIGIASAIALADIPVYKGVKSIYRTISGGDKLGTGNRVTDCKRAKNRKTPYCQQWKARQKTTWRGIQRHGGPEAPPVFSLHGGE